MARKNMGRDLFWLFVCGAAGYGCMIEGEYLPDLVPLPKPVSVSALEARCGDGVVGGEEACDDGNTEPGDGCDERCEVELCFTCRELVPGGRSSCGPQCDVAGGESCVLGMCVSCTDGIRNGDETDVDCGGSCGPCDQGLSCLAEGDCVTGACSGGVCCNEACGDVCVRCDLPGAVGVCSYVPENEPHEALACEVVTLCDGKGGCKKVAQEACVSGKECLSGNCLDGQCK